MVVRLLLQYFNPPFGMLAVSMLSFRVGLHSLVLVVCFLSMPIVAASQPSSAVLLNLRQQRIQWRNELVTPIAQRRVRIALRLFQPPGQIHSRRLQR